MGLVGVFNVLLQGRGGVVVWEGSTEDATYKGYVGEDGDGNAHGCGLGCVVGRLRLRRSGEERFWGWSHESYIWLEDGMFKVLACSRR